MKFRDIPIQKKLIRFIFLISGVVLFVTSLTFFSYEVYTFRQSSVEKLSTIGKIISSNSTAALAFDNPQDANEILSALKNETHVVAACLYDEEGKLFAQYPLNLKPNAFPEKPGIEGYSFTNSHLEGFQPVILGGRSLGTLYLKSDLEAMYDRFRLYGIIVIVVIIISFVLAYLLSNVLQSSISTPILSLAETAKLISEKKDYSVRASKKGNDELGNLTDAFNQMLGQIQEQDKVMTAFNQNLEQNVKERTVELESANKFLKQKEEEQAELVKKLQKATEQMEIKNNLLTGISEVNDTLRGVKDLNILAQDIVHKLTTDLEAQIGAIYLKDGKDELKWVAGYAFDNGKKQSIIKFGEGLTGQAASQQKIILFKNVPEDYAKITSALGEVLPKNIIVLPIIYSEEVIGVIEVGSVNEFSSQQLDYINLVGESIAIAFNSAQVRHQQLELLEETQRQAEELESQKEELSQTNEELNVQTQRLQVSEEELRLQQAELQKSNKELVEKNEAIEEARNAISAKAEEIERTSKYKSEFLANMSHELRTPLNSILILGKLLHDNKDNNLTKKQTEYAEIIYKSGNDLLNLINDILDLSKIEAGKVELEVGDVSLKEITSDISTLFAEVANSKKIHFELNIAKDLKQGIKTDKTRLEQVLKNLLSNAFKFTPEGGTVSFNVNKAEPGIVYNNEKLRGTSEIIEFSVSDSGIGIAKDKLGLIFEAFQQADGSTSRRFGGTGLGLSISKELISRLGGEIQVVSEVGKGSKFTIYLPVEYIETEADKVGTKSEINVSKSQEKALSELIIKESSAEKTILIIEDDHNFARILQDLAREKKYKTIVANKGDVGLEYARKYLPHAIILDIQLPVMDGWAILKKLKEDSSLRNIPVHIISVMDEWKTDNSGVNSYLQKPINYQELNSAFDKISMSIDEDIKNLLIIEDDKDLNRSIIELIRANQPSVVCYSAATGQDAIEKLELYPIDCILLDLGLKDISGFELLDKIKAEPKFATIPIIVNTGRKISQEEEMKLKKAGATIAIKSSDSNKRLLEETLLFLHKIKQSSPTPIIYEDLKDVLSGKTVLLTDDDMRNVFSLTAALEPYGLKIIAAWDGKEALNKLSEEIDIVLMDIMMPEMDGYEAIREIRKNSKYKELPIIALTAKAMKEDRAKCLEAGASDYISKPVNVMQLLSLMRTWLYNKKK